MSADTGKTGQNATNPGEGVFSGMMRNGLLPAIFVTLGVIAAIEILSSTAFYIPNAGVVSLLAVVYAAYSGGIRAGLVSAAMTSIYVAWNFSSPGESFHFDEFNLHRVIVFSFVAPAMAVMVGTLRRRSGLYEATAIANAVLRTRLAERETLGESQRLAAGVFENAQEGIMVTDAANYILAVNPAFTRITGYAAAEAIGKNPRLLSSGLQDAGFYRAMWAAITETGRWNGEIWDRRKNGDVFCSWLSVSTVKDAGGRTTGHIAVFSDITERKALEQKHRELLQHQRALLDGIAERAWLKDADGRYLAVNRSFAELAGFSPDQLVGKTTADILPPDAARRYETEDREVMRSGETVRTERASILDQGKTWREIVKVPVRGDDGRVIGIAVTSRDITERKQADAALKESEERFRRIAENIREIFWIGDRYFKKMLYVSPAFEEIWGMPLRSIYRNPLAWRNRVHPDDLAIVAEALDKQSERKSFEAEFRIIRSDGTTRWIRSRSFPYTSQGEEFVTGVAEDITDLKHAEEERLAHALRQRDTLVREVHHRIKNNLQAVAGLLMHETSDHPELRALLQKAMAQVQLIAVVHGIQGEAKAQEIPLCEMVPAIARIVESLTESRIPVDVNIDMPRPAQLRERESVPIALILNELLLNATKHSPQDAQPGEIKVTISRDGNSVEVRIFNPGSLPPGFNFAAGIATGTGLGLVRSLMPRQGAELAFRGSSEGVATVLRLGAPVIDF